MTKKSNKCIHNRDRSYCRQCGGSRHCVHDRLKYFCVDCNGAGICEHKHIRNTCKLCNGNQLCEHNIARSYCRKCKGSAFCQHGNQRYNCRDCKGKGICEHNRIKHSCRDCNGSDFCVHGNRKYTCKDCGGKGLCIHNREKKHCKLCFGSCMCIHRRRKMTCKECGGKGICKHNKIRQQCRDCDGSRFCIHGKNKGYCKPCGGSRLCRSPHCHTTATKKYKMYCVSCYIQQFPNDIITTNHKRKEHRVVEFIRTQYPDIKWIFDRKVEGGSSRYRPDMYTYIRNFVYIIEVDENQHVDYDETHENQRLRQLIQDFKGKSIVLVRFNPDKYIDEHGTKIPSCWMKTNEGVLYIPDTRLSDWNERLSILKASLDYWLDHDPKETLFVDQIFFDDYRIIETEENEYTGVEKPDVIIPTEA